MISPQTMFKVRSERTWLLIFFCWVYFCFCWTTYTFTVEPLYGFSDPYSIGADSGAYFERAGLADPNDASDVDKGGLVSLGGSSLGPVVIALIGRGAFGVACINGLIFLLIIYWAGLIPGVNRLYFTLLMMAEPQLLPTLMTLNKEILGIAGLVSFAAYRFRGAHGVEARGSKFLLFTGIVLSVLARWEQVLILFWFMTAESKRSPLHRRPRLAVVVLLFVLSAGWAAAVHVLHLNLEGFLSQIKGGGTVTRLYAIQDKGGYFLVALPKVLMNISGRWITPAYFLHDYWLEDFGPSLQNRFIGILSSLLMLVTLSYALIKDRFRLTRPLIHLTVIYFFCMAILPFIQHRYIYPAYALLALELARSKFYREPVRPLPAPPPLPPSYRNEQRAFLAQSNAAQRQ